MKKDTFVYPIGDALYLNLTNRCTNRCAFCVRDKADGVGGHYLWLSREPEAQEVIDEIDRTPGYRKIVFCGFGEPTIRLEQLKKIAAHCKEKGYNVRINTNGHANAYHGRDVTPELKGLVDVVSVSLNAATPREYEAICRSTYGEKGFEYMLDFARSCAKNGIKVVLSVVNVIGEEKIRECEKIAQSVGGTLRVREYIQ